MVLSHQKFHWEHLLLYALPRSGNSRWGPGSNEQEHIQKVSSAPYSGTGWNLVTGTKSANNFLRDSVPYVKSSKSQLEACEVAGKPLSMILLKPESSYGSTRAKFHLVSLGAQIVGVDGTHNIWRCPQNFQGIIIVMIVVVECVCVVTRACGAGVENKEQLCGVNSVFLLSCGSRGSNSGLQAYTARAFTQQVLFLSLNFLFLERVKNTMGPSEIPSWNLENSWRNRYDREQRLRKLRLLRVPATLQLLPRMLCTGSASLSPCSCPDGSHAPFHPIKLRHEAAWGWRCVAVVPTLGRSRHCEFQVPPVSKQTKFTVCYDVSWPSPFFLPGPWQFILIRITREVSSNHNSDYMIPLLRTMQSLPISWKSKVTDLMKTQPAPQHLALLWPPTPIALGFLSTLALQGCECAYTLLHSTYKTERIYGATLCPVQLIQPMNTWIITMGYGFQNIYTYSYIVFNKPCSPQLSAEKVSCPAA